jgi:hypothetical protein
MPENRRPMSDADRSKRLALHLVLNPGWNMDQYVDALKEEMAMHTRENVNVGWRVFGDVEVAEVRECMRMPEKFRREVCFGDHMGKPHSHIRVWQMFDRPFQVVRS